MARFFITGSSDGIGSATARHLISLGHNVVLHARSPSRAADAASLCPGSAAVLVGDLSSIDETKALAAEANKLGPYDAVIHNAGLYTGAEKITGKSGLPALFTVNTLAPYVLTCLMDKPKRLVYVSSGLHYGGKLDLGEGLVRSGYGDTKLHNVMLAKAFARRWENVGSYSADPGWIATKMGGEGATGSMKGAVRTYTMLALGEDGLTNGGFYASGREKGVNKVADDVDGQEGLLKKLEQLSGVKVPE
ncbi:hypothetical protein B0T17DRAFT_543843 [Bombardia bombarda]|uniref:Uncharacterized protein n=1 Tax=Bombardia bombarda TaxID=252184 RepID=A0AA39W4U2_9PEZI|nr:hypothetical protein B0T17DRAFT_543843 [Bombardia bombarda]